MLYQKYFSFGFAFLTAAPGTAAFFCGSSCHSPRSQSCTIVVQEKLGVDYVAQNRTFECILDPLDAEGRNVHVSVPIVTTDEQKQIFLTKFELGELISASSTLIFDEGIQIGLDGIFISPHKTSLDFGQNHPTSNDSGRLLASTEGEKHFLVVKVTDSEGRKRPESTDEISDDIFGTYGDQLTLKSQMEACSYNNFRITAGVGDEHEVSPGVVEVTIGKSLVGNDAQTIEDAVTKELQLLLGHDIPGPYAHVMYVLQGCYTHCGWAAYAYVNSWLSVYQGHYYKLVGVQMHEIGHNLNLAHSGGLDGIHYSDHTGMMGNPLYSDDFGAMCFNAAKSWQLGWYDDSKIIINPRIESWKGRIIGIADYENNPLDHPVIVKVESGTATDQYITFNRATGVNRHNDEADNEVTILETGNDGESYHQSWLKATLHSGEAYIIPFWDGAQDLTISAEAININSEDSAGYAEVSICLGPCVYPTDRPSDVPSIAPASGGGPMHYSQIGVDINGVIADGALGHSVTISKDGTRVAIAAPGEDGGKGVTRAYNWQPHTEEWIQVGQEIVGTALNGGLGWSMAMNEDGSRIVLGAPEANNDDGLMRVYELDSTNAWNLLGDEISPVVGSKGQAGVSVSMNASGDRVAFGAPRTNQYSGRVQIFQFEGGQWISMGQTIDADAPMSYSGGSIAMDADGGRIVIGSKLGDYYKGTVMVYDYNVVSSQWEVSAFLHGLDYYDRFGGSVDINEDGTRIVVGAPTSDGQALNVFDAGEFYAFDYNGTEWNLLGQKIIGEAQMDKLGDGVTISGDGTHIAISSPESDDNGNNAGKVEVYKYSEEDQAWVQQGLDILGECAGYRFGEGGGAIALDRTGDHLAVGALRGNYYAGLSRVFTKAEGEGSINSGSENECQ